MEPSIEKCRQILSVSERASLEEVKEAYLDLAKVWHPDRFAGNGRLERKATEKLIEINAAYHTLVTYYESIEGKAAAKHPEPDEEPAPQEAAPTECAEPEKPKRRGFRAFMVILCAVVIIAAGVYAFMAYKGRRPAVTVRIVLPPTAGTAEESAPAKKSPQAAARQKESTGNLKKGTPEKRPPSKGGYYTLGSTKDEVLAVEGSPQQISDNRWNYGSSYVDFSKGRVIGWHTSTLDPLRVRMAARKDTEEAFFTVGSTKEEVAAIQGTPTQVSGNRWSYGFSRVDFAKGKVAGWYSSALDPLRVKMIPKTETERTFFTIGSTKAEVLAAQGTPTQLTETRWSYGYSYVDFENGKVTKWYNSEQDPLAIEEE